MRAFLMQHNIPVPGQRIFRSVLAVWLCLAVYLLRGKGGIPLYSLVAALSCMQPYTSDMNTAANKRLLGTIIGAVWGLLFVLLERVILGGDFVDDWGHILLVGLFVGIVIYFTVLVKVNENAFFAAAVFLTVAVSHIDDANPAIYALNRLLDTAIGIVISEILNRLHLPRLQNRKTLFVSTIGETIVHNHKMSPYTKVELNRLIQSGAMITVSTVESQATVRELLPGIDLQCPIITLDGAALYDMRNMLYLKTVPMADENAKLAMDWAHEQGLHFFSSSIKENLLIIHYAELANSGMQALYEKDRKSPYRNFVRTPADRHDGVLYMLILDSPEKIASAYEDFMHQPWADQFRVMKGDSEFEGYDALKLYDAKASRPNMLRELEEMLEPEHTITLGSVPGKYDVYIPAGDRDRLAKEIKRRYEPVNFRGWRNMFRFV